MFSHHIAFYSLAVSLGVATLLVGMTPLPVLAQGSSLSDTDVKIIVKISEDKGFEVLDELGRRKSIGNLGAATKILYSANHAFGIKDIAKIVNAAKSGRKAGQDAVSEVVSDKIKDSYLDLLTGGFRWVLDKAAIPGISNITRLNLITSVILGIFETEDIHSSSSFTAEEHRKAYALLEHLKQEDQLRFIDKLLTDKGPNATELPDYLRPKKSPSSRKNSSAEWKGYFVRADGKGRTEVSISTAGDGKYSTYAGNISFSFVVTKVDTDERGRINMTCRTLPQGETFALTGDNNELVGDAFYLDTNKKRVEGRMILKTKN